MAKMVRVTILSDFLKWLPCYFFPKTCYECGKEGFFACPDCKPKVAKAINSLICPMCQKQSPLGMTHSECRKTNGLDGLISYYRYAGWAKEIVKDAKFGLNPHWRAMKELAEEMAKAISSSQLSVLARPPGLRPCEVGQGYQLSDSSQSVVGSSVSETDKQRTGEPVAENRKLKTDNRNFVVVPVPLHWWRKMKRGFNQAEIIAKPIAESLNLPLRTNLVERSAYSLPQTLVGDNFRRANVKKSFRINSVFSIQNSKLDTVFLIDDVWTTGATMKECCRTLKLAGVKKVWGVTLLRA
ncbi:ComF family protein [Candidatus Collierbacteria bacterium]|nr:ComF family protein [Candidatus Collierbacteria bacterium]